MKKSHLVFSILLFAARSHAVVSGGLDFDNLAGPNIDSQAVTIGPNGRFSEGAIGAFVGSDYTAAAFYLHGSFLDQHTFDFGSPIHITSADTAFLGTTGNGPSDPNHNPNADGTGLFARAEEVVLPLTGTITVEVRSWFNGGGLYTSYDQAFDAGANVGESSPFLFELQDFHIPPQDLNGLQPFQVNASPEPSTFALCGAGMAALLFFRRRK